MSNRNEKKKNQIHKNKPVYLGLLILNLGKITIYDFWCDYIKLIYGKKIKTVL